MLRASRSIRPREQLGVRLMGVVAALVMLCGASVSAPIDGARAAEPEPTAAESAATSDDDATDDAASEDAVAADALPADPAPIMVVTPTQPVVPVNAEEYGFEVLLRNIGENDLEGGTITLWLDSVRTESRAELTADPSTRQPMLLAQLGAPPLAAWASQEFSISLPRDEMPLVSSREAGVYLLRAELTVGGARSDGTAASTPVAQATSPFVWGGTAAEPLPLTMIVPLVLPTSVSGVPTSSDLDRVVPSLTALLDAAEGHAATLAVDPRIVVGIRGLGTAAPAAAVTLLERLELTSNPVFMLQFADADPSVQAALGIEALMQPLGFDYVTATGTFTPPEPPPPMVMVETDVVVGDGVPSRDELMSLANARVGAWPAQNEVDSGTLALLANAGITSVVLSSGNASDASGTRVSLGEFEALIADDELGAAAATALSADTALERRSAEAALAALTALDAGSGSGGSILALDRAAVADAAEPQQLIGALGALPWVQTVDETQQPEGVAALRAGGSGEDRRERLRAMTSRSAQIDAMAPLLVQPEYLLEYERVRLMGAFATRYAGLDVDFAEVDAAMRERDQELLAGVHPVATESVQLVGASSRVPVLLRNWLPFDAKVQLRAAPQSAALAVPERRFESVVPTGGTASVLVPVQSRVSSGQSGLVLEVRDVEGLEVFAEALLPLTLRTAIETMLLVGLGVAAALLLGLGIWRSVMRRRSLGVRE